VLDGASRGVFFGRILVRKGAQKTAAEQENNNLLLSRKALANSTPQLEIFADDVQCRHGSTIGQVDEAPLFYARSRGIGEAEARRIMTFAFVNEIIQRVGIAPLRERLAERLIRLGPGDAS
jgi:Fe-S cluster assembly protein SufD